jgi:hypothetical protein
MIKRNRFHEFACGVDSAQSELTEQEAQNGASYVRSLLPHVLECDGLSIMAELLPDKTMQQLLDAGPLARCKPGYFALGGHDPRTSQCELKEA